MPRRVSGGSVVDWQGRALRLEALVGFLLDAGTAHGLSGPVAVPRDVWRVALEKCQVLGLTGTLIYRCHPTASADLGADLVWRCCACQRPLGRAMPVAPADVAPASGPGPLEDSRAGCRAVLRELFEVSGYSGLPVYKSLHFRHEVAGELGHRLAALLDAGRGGEGR